MTLFATKRKPKPRKADYAKRAGDALRWSRQTSEDIRDIGPPPAVQNPRRRRQAMRSLECFLMSYFRAAFPLRFSDDHRTAIKLLESVCDNGGLYAFGMPRGFGKTTICTRAALWALLTGRRRSVAIIGATEGKARKILENIKKAVCWNRALYADFPNELHGLPQLNGQNKRAAGQICKGAHTLPSLMTSRIVFPTADHNPISGVIVSTCGITGDIRGLVHDRLDGTVIRPDLVILDDPQTKESAQSALQTNTREETIYADVLGLAGPGQEIAAIMPCTVIHKDDLADRMLTNPQWQSTRGKMLYRMPDNLPLWDENIQIRNEGLRVQQSRAAGDRHYLANRAAMDVGGQVGWPERKSEKRGERGDISALQHAMYLYYQNPKAFAAEYQNEPIDESASADAPTFRGLADKLTRLPRGFAPSWAHWLTIGIDTQLRYLVYVVLASAPGFTSCVIDYGAWPGQSRAYFDRNNAHPTLQTECPNSTQYAGALFHGLQGLTSSLLSRQWQQDGRGVLSISKAIIDSGGHENAGEVVFNFCRQSPFAAVLMPSKGVGIGAKARPMRDWPKPKDNREQMGQDWLIKLPENHRAVKHVRIDVNSWKTFMAARAAAAAGETGRLEIFGERPEQHQMFFDHLAGESPTATFGQGRHLWEWTSIPNRENDYLDALVMAGVGASMCGAALKDMPNATGPARQTVIIPPHLRRRPNT